jgi:hypothetical protein
MMGALALTPSRKAVNGHQWPPSLLRRSWLKIDIAHIQLSYVRRFY